MLNFCNCSRDVSVAIFVVSCGTILSGCASYPSWLPSTGPSREQVTEVKIATPGLPIQVVDVTDAVARRVLASQTTGLFSETFLGKAPVGYTVGPGDILEVSVW